MVAARPGWPGTYDFTWVSGAHDPAYGLSMSGVGEPMSEAQMRTTISEFLDEINPDTGYLA
ncbi:hypothetical protein GB931_08075 [Modestobacter sp. I12A-02628]|uniref:Uncharacterized protein n=1 Tax=Goekera deserti TaxID=2497753 RepID=A0A7K3WF24_9ACTN|nr:hypothetical protein [Goekera deserti]MPQ97880.1 hypothetical protein [Goekera deserti]NDI48526.1 hypothetical protein [Goekera deserti]NEL55095.1 hypothetical protein [Goekera deserti]